MLIIGIDPDLDKSGVAVWCTVKKEFLVLSALNINDLLATLKPERTMEGMFFPFGYYGMESIKSIRIDAGWLNKKSNYHKQQGPRRRERIAKNVGENHGVGKIIAQILEARGFKIELIKPTNAKLTFDNFNRITSNKYLSNFDKLKTFKQEIIDAAMLVYGL